MGTVLARERRGDGYAGPDRRGVLGVAHPSRPSLVAGAVLWALAFPFVAAALVTSLPFLTVPAWTAGVSDVAFVELLAGAAVLVLHWRLAGEAAAVPAATGAAATGLYFLPTSARLPWPGTGYPAALRLVATVAVLVLGIYSSALPEVKARLRPAPFMVRVLVLVPVGAGALCLVPARALLGYRLAGALVTDLAASLAALGVGGLLLARAARNGRHVLAGAGGTDLALAGAWAVLAWYPSGGKGGWASMPSMFLAAGATMALVLTGPELSTVLKRVVRQDVRGRRRWEMAERELARVRRSYQAQRHDINSMLSAIDGTLMVLAGQRESMSGADVDRLTTAVRNEVHSLRRILTGPGAPATYDLSQLCLTVTALQNASGGRARAHVQEGLQVQGHPERLASVLGNLLANATAYAPGAPVELSARRTGELVEVLVVDHGPGLTEAEQAMAFEAHWRGRQSYLQPGNGLGLYQCRQLVEAEGGTIGLGTTDPAAPPGRRGLSASVRLPARWPASRDEDHRGG